MSKITIRIEDNLKARIAAAACALGEHPAQPRARPYRAGNSE